MIKCARTCNSKKITADVADLPIPALSKVGYDFYRVIRVIVVRQFAVGKFPQGFKTVSAAFFCSFKQS